MEYSGFGQPNSEKCKLESEENVSSEDSLTNTMMAGVSATQGKRSSMEDTYSVRLWSKVRKDDSQTESEEYERPTKRLRTEDKIAEGCSADSPLTSALAGSDGEESNRQLEETRVSFFTVCDGHGGVQAADFVNNHLFDNIIACPNFLEDTETAILSGFEQTEKAFSKFVRDEEIDGMIGTTVTAVLIIENQLYIANLGDSEAVLCSGGKDHLLTEPHIPSNPQEECRVKHVGGTIVADKRGTKRLGHPAWNSKLVNIGVTRAIGDYFFKNEEYVGTRQSGLIAVPSIKKWNLTAEDQFLIIASDGFWDVVKHKEAVDFVNHNLDLDSDIICKQLLELSSSRRSNDNITVLLIKFAMPKPEPSDNNSDTPCVTPQ